MSLPEAARALLALPPDRFVAERDALARELASRGDRAAAEVKKLRRPVGLAWVLNHLARERGGDVEALLRAGDRLRAGHRRAVAGGGPGELREAEEELRERARALRSEAARALDGAGRRADPAVLSRVELLLRLLAPLPGPDRDAFRSGALAAEPSPSPADVGGLALVAGGRAAPAQERAPGPRAAAPSGRAAARDAREARRQQEARQAREAKRAAAEAAHRAREARLDADRADAGARRAEAA
ncbi:MAG TPA: hypothetical protein VFK90_00555, partial [Anaeromyxobacter sp.]|nr:hypothetical protein [Anaeromyxobacter sp.]